MCESKTRVAVLEESKATLSMQIVNLKKLQASHLCCDQRHLSQSVRKNIKSPRAVEVTVEKSGFGVFGMGGDLSVKVQPI